MSLKEGHSNKICYVASNLFLTEDKMNKQCCGLTFFLLKKKIPPEKMTKWLERVHYEYKRSWNGEAIDYVRIHFSELHALYIQI